MQNVERREAAASRSSGKEKRRIGCIFIGGGKGGLFSPYPKRGKKSASGHVKGSQKTTVRLSEKKKGGAARLKIITRGGGGGN